VVEIILRITRDVRSTKAYKRKHTDPSDWNNTLLPIHSTRSNICSDNQSKFQRSHKSRARATHKPTSSANQQYTGLKKYDEKPFWANGNYARPPHSQSCLLHLNNG
jgi:hypothetical protein